MFEVELISIGDAPPVVNVFKQIDGDEDNHLSKEEVRAGNGGNVICLWLWIQAAAITLIASFLA